MPKVWDVKYPALTACSKEIEVAFQEGSQLNVSFYANGYEFMKKLENGRQSL